MAKREKILAPPSKSLTSGREILQKVLRNPIPNHHRSRHLVPGQPSNHSRRNRFFSVSLRHLHTMEPFEKFTMSREMHFLPAPPAHTTNTNKTKNRPPEVRGDRFFRPRMAKLPDSWGAQVTRGKICTDTTLCCAGYDCC